MTAATQLLDSSLTSKYFIYDTDHQLWVAKTHLLTEMGISENTVREGLRDYKAKGKGSWTYEVYGHNDTWILYDTIPALTRQRVSDYYGQLHKTCVHRAASALILRGRFEAACEPNDAEWFLSQSVKQGGRSFTTSEAKDLRLACGILRQLDDDINNKVWRKGIRADKDTIITDGNGYISFVASVIKSWNLFGFKVGNGRVLYRKIKEWVESNRASLISDRFGKANAEKKTDDLLRTAIVLKASATKPTDRDVALELGKRYNMPLTPQTIGNWLNEPEAHRQLLAAREGKVYAQKKSAIWIAQGKYRHADEVWLVDATTVQMMVADDKGKRVKLPMNRVTVLDGYSEKRVGVAYGISETAELVWQALYFAFKTTGRLPQVIRSDKGSANTRKDLVSKFDLLGITHITGQAHRSTRQRLIEYDQHKHERVLQRFCENFAGGNFMGRGQQMRFNPDNLKRLEQEGKLPTWLEGIGQDFTLFMAGNSIVGKDGKTPNERYSQSEHAERRTGSLKLLVNVFEPRKDLYTYHNGQILFRHNGQDLTYWVGSHLEIDEDFYRRHEGNKFRIRFNQDDASIIGLYSEKWDFVAVAHQKHKFGQNPKALSTDERLALNHNLAVEKRLNTEGATGLKQIKEAMTARQELTYIDYQLKTKDDLQGDELNELYHQVSLLGILDKERKPMNGNTATKQKTLRAETTAQTQHFFQDDEAAQALLD